MFTIVNTWVSALTWFVGPALERVFCVDMWSTLSFGSHGGCEWLGTCTGVALFAGASEFSFEFSIAANTLRVFPGLDVR